MKDDIANGRKPIGQRTIFYDMLTNDEVRPEKKRPLISRPRRKLSSLQGKSPVPIHNITPHYDGISLTPPMVAD